jgi:hypothetical protein
MPKVRNASGGPLEIHLGLPGPRQVGDGEVVDIPADLVYAYTVQPIWETVDAEAEAAHTKGEKAEKAALYEERKRRGELTDDELEKEAAAAEKAVKKGNS